MTADHVTQHTAWIEQVRDPADASTLRELQAARGDGATAEIELAPIPTGWASRARIERRDGSGAGSPWSGPHATREEAIEHALAFLRRRSQSTPDLLASIESHAAQPALIGGDW